LFIPTLLCDVAATLVTSRRWWDRIDDRIILGGLPLARHAKKLHALGVRRVVNMCNEYAGPIAAYERLGIRQLRLPTPDFSSPTLADINAAIAFVQQVESSTDLVYVHCKAGMGRSATVALCWLMLTQALAPDRAEARLRKIRPHVNQNLSRRAVVEAFASRHALATNSHDRRQKDKT
jgi:atypical dual specificity phosphatase